MRHAVLVQLYRIFVAMNKIVAGTILGSQYCIMRHAVQLYGFWIGGALGQPGGNELNFFYLVEVERA